MAKTKRARSTHVMPEPKWSELKLLTEDEDREKALSSCLYFSHYEIQDKTGVPPLKKWMKANWDKSDVDKILIMPDSTFHSVGKYFYCWNKLGWLPTSVLNWIENQKAVWLNKASAYVEIKEEKPKVVIPRDNLNQFAIGVDDMIDNVIGGSQLSNIKQFVELYKLNNIETEDAVTIVDTLAMEFRLLAEGTDADLIEGYSHIKKSTLKNLLDFFDGIITGLLETKQAKKITRIKRKRPVDKTKLVRRLKYTVKHPELMLKSIDPVEIIGASEVWVYDIKRKRIGVYASEYENTLGVKGTVIDNYSFGKSYEKTVRKDEKVKDFMACRKNGLHNFMDKVRGKKYPAKSRVQATMVLLRVIK